MTEPRDVFDKLATAKLQDFADPELVALHKRAAGHLEEAVVKEYDGKSYNSDYEAEFAEKTIERFRSTRKWKKGFYEE